MDAVQSRRGKGLHLGKKVILIWGTFSETILILRIKKNNYSNFMG